MMKEKSDSLGEYFSNSFIIKCNTDIDFNNLSNCDSYNQLGTFIHEYIHFFQNASTTYGNMNMAYYYAKTLSRLNIISTSEKLEVSRVRRLPSSVDDAAIMCELTLGDTYSWTYDTVSNIEILSSGVNSDECIDEKFKTYNVPTLSLKLSSGNIEKNEEFRFGARAISESMASLYEKKIYSVSFAKVQVQYDICTILWNKYAPTMYKDRTDLIFAMCECSLMFTNPGIIFYSVLTFLVAKETDEITVNTIFKYFSIQPDFEKNYTHYYNEMLRLFDALTPCNNNFMKSLNQYVHNFSDNLFIKREKNFHWLTDLYVLKPDKMKSRFLGIIMQTKAVPLIINRNNEIYSGIIQEENKMDMIYYYSIYAFNNLIDYNGSRQCVLYNICCRNGVSEVDINCKESPWVKSNSSNLCPMGVIWHMWNLSGKELIY